MPEPKKKKTKEEKEAERKKAEEARRLAEEARLQAEEEARRLAAEVELKRRQLLEQHLAVQAERVRRQRDASRVTEAQLAAARRAAAVSRAAELEWARYTSCSHLPDPRVAREMNGQLGELAAAGQPATIADALAAAEGSLRLAAECRLLALEAAMQSACSSSSDACTAGSGELFPSQPTAADDAGAGTDPAGAARAAGEWEEGLGPAAGDAGRAVEEGVAASSERTPRVRIASSARGGSAAAAPAGDPAGPAAAAAAGEAAAAAPERAPEVAPADAGRLLQYEEQLHRHVVRQIDGATAAALFRADGPSEGKAAGGEPQQSEASRAGVSWGLWVNTARNPRLRVVEWPGLGVAIEVPKQIALANVALRVLRLPFDDRRGRCSRGLAAVGSVLRAELLALPPPARRAGGWVVRQMTPLATGVSVVPYPIPPAGTDPAAWRAQEPAAPLTFTMPIPDDVIVPLDYGGERDAGAAAAAAAAAAATADGADPAARGGAASGLGDEAAENKAAAAAAAREQEGATAESEQRRQQQQQLPEPQPRVGWWDDAAGCWSEEGISGIRFQPGRRLLTFSTARLGTLALLAPRARLLPYRSWDLRPTGGLGGATVALTLRPCAPLPEPLVIDVGPAWARLASPDLPELCGLIGRQLPPWQLLQRLADAGLNLLPDAGACGGGGLVGGGAEEAARADRGGKDEEMERAMCNDVSRIWLSEVTDWEEGGRTGPGHGARIFSKERDSGERRVLLAVREGTEGVAFSDAPDRGASPPQPPDFESVEAVVAAAKDPRGQLHFDLPSLLAGPPPELAPHPRAPALRAGPAALEAAAAFDAAASEAVARVLCALRPFSNG